VAHDGHINSVEADTSTGEIMSTNQPGKPRIRLIEEAGAEITEGHAIKARGVSDAGDDVAEGHGFRGNVDEAGDETTEGHGFRGNVDEAGDETTEGHAARFKP
jgi:hypothetical protein